MHILIKARPPRQPESTPRLFGIVADGEPLLFLTKAHLDDIDLPLGCTRDRGQAERWAQEAAAAGHAEVHVVELTY